MGIFKRLVLTALGALWVYAAFGQVETTPLGGGGGFGGGAGNSTPALTYNTSRFIAGCPIWPDNNIFNTRVDQLPVDQVLTDAIYGPRSNVLSASWAAGVVTMNLDAIATGITQGAKVFVNGVGVQGYNTGFGCNKIGAPVKTLAGNFLTCSSFDVRVAVSSIVGNTITYPVATDPGATVGAGGYVSVGIYASIRLGSAPSMGINIIDNSMTPLVQPVLPPNISFASNDYESDNVFVPMTVNSIMEGYNGGGPNLVSMGPYGAVADAHVFFLNRDTCQLTELYNLKSAAIPFQVLNISMWYTHRNEMRTARLHTADVNAGLTSTDAAGLPVYPLTLTRAQVYGGDPIRMIRWTAPVTAGWWVWPASHKASNNNMPFVPPQGQISRLKGSFDLTTCAQASNAGQLFPAFAQKVMTAMKQYGLVMGDNGAAGLITTSQDFTPEEDAALVGWLHCIPGTAFEVVNTEPYQLNQFSYEVFTPTRPNVPGLIDMTVTSTPSTGVPMTVDSSGCTTPCTVGWLPGSTHTLQAFGTTTGVGTRVGFQSWSDAGAAQHDVIAQGTPTTYTAAFTAQNLLTVATSPAASGVVSPVTQYVDAGATVTIQATNATGWNFTGFTGDLSGATNPQNLVMSAPKSVSATFAAVNTVVSLATSPAGLTIIADGGTCTATCIESWRIGSVHNIETDNQAGGGGTYVFTSWSDGGAQNHNVTVPGGPVTITATFTLQYQVTTAVNSTLYGSIAPATAFYNNGDTPTITATPTAGNTFSVFTGDITGGTNPQTLAPITGNETITANFRTAGAWYDPAWTFRKRVVVPANKFTADHAAFRMWIDLIDPDIAASALSNGNDILWTASDGTTKLPHDIDTLDLAHSRIASHVLAATSASVSNVFYVYYGNAAAADQRNAAGVWTGISAVYHFGDGATLSLVDSTGNGNTLTNSSPAVTAGVGELSGGASFINTLLEKLSAANSATLQIGIGAGTVEAWINLATGHGFTNPVATKLNTSGVAEYSLEVQGQTLFYVTASTNINLGCTITNDTWTHVAFVYDGATNVTGYKNGVACAPSSPVLPTTVGTGVLNIGFRGGSYWSGAIDELRILKGTALTASVLADQVTNQTAPTTFMQVGAQER